MSAGTSTQTTLGELRALSKSLVSRGPLRAAGGKRRGGRTRGGGRGEVRGKGNWEVRGKLGE